MTRKYVIILIAALCSIKVYAETLQCPKLENQIGWFAVGREWLLADSDLAIWEYKHDLQTPSIFHALPDSVFGGSIKVTAFIIPREGHNDMECLYTFSREDNFLIIRAKRNITQLPEQQTNWMACTGHINPLKDRIDQYETTGKDKYKCETTGANLEACVVDAG